MRLAYQKQWNNQAPAIDLISGFIMEGARRLMAAYNDEENFSNKQIEAIIDNMERNSDALHEIMIALTSETLGD